MMFCVYKYRKFSRRLFPILYRIIRNFPPFICVYPLLSSKTYICYITREIEAMFGKWNMYRFQAGADTYNLYKYITLIYS